MRQNVQKLQKKQVWDENNMSDKFVENVNKPIQKFAVARKRVNNKAASVGLAAVQSLYWLFKYTLLTNAPLRRLEDRLEYIDIKNKDGKNNKFKAFNRRYPSLSAHMYYYMILASMIGGIKIADNISSEKEDVKKEISIPVTFGAYREKIKPITPFLIADLIAKEGVHMQNGMHTPYLDSNNIPTIGFGSTKLKDGTSVSLKTAPISTDEAYELARWHLEDGETYFLMYCYDVAFETVDINTVAQAAGIGSIIFNSGSKLIENPTDKNHRERFAELRNEYNELGFGVTDSIIQKHFEKYSVVSKRSFGEKLLSGAPMSDVADKLGEFLADGRGLYWRRWLEAGLLTGDITLEMMLDCPANGMYEFFKVMGKTRDSFFTGQANSRQVNKDTFVKFKEWLKNPVDEHGVALSTNLGWKKVRDCMPSEIVQLCANGKCELGTENASINPVQVRAEKKTYVIGYNDMYAVAIDAYKSKNYTSAAIQFENMIKLHPDNALLRNDLADTYNKLSRYDDAIAQAREVVRRIGDKGQYGAANYNAGVAYEKLGKLQNALANYKLAVANGNRRAVDDVARVTNIMRQGTRTR
jgi:tetratricopeptide (TPR) repeat protein